MNGQVDMWGQLKATYTRYPIPGAGALRRAHAAEVAHRLPTKPISALATGYPAARLDLTAFGGVGLFFTSDDDSVAHLRWH